jgi:hypothetical protein
MFAEPIHCRIWLLEDIWWLICWGGRQIGSWRRITLFLSVSVAHSIHRPLKRCWNVGNIQHLHCTVTIQVQMLSQGTELIYTSKTCNSVKQHSQHSFKQMYYFSQRYCQHNEIKILNQREFREVTLLYLLIKITETFIRRTSILLKLMYDLQFPESWLFMSPLGVNECKSLSSISCRHVGLNGKYALCNLLYWNVYFFLIIWRVILYWNVSFKMVRLRMSWYILNSIDVYDNSTFCVCRQNMEPPV